jgi:hypothetical protein
MPLGMAAPIMLGQLAKMMEYGMRGAGGSDEMETKKQKEGKEKKSCTDSFPIPVVQDS